MTGGRRAIEAASPVVAAALAGVAPQDLPATKVIVPPIPGLSPARAAVTLRAALVLVDRWPPVSRCEPCRIRKTGTSTETAKHLLRGVQTSKDGHNSVHRTSTVRCGTRWSLAQTSSCHQV